MEFCQKYNSHHKFTFDVAWYSWLDLLCINPSGVNLGKTTRIKERNVQGDHLQNTASFGTL